ncbi:EamA family transporter [Kineococcus rhizosphaerae]|uniref:EamA-like transporter family protein n=1 Tax=Kineococcus rhizosphaerae TaxID=559628 RepID=A0A2T0RAP3_9ACTN|nr:EamA family transporter [Kineococcus rhizosphaerae]PRY18227.1 EamA-like transporter family protein [Kineococcus rhizosphaerae]
MSVALALMASFLWGGSDFVGGSVSRRLRAGQVLAVSQALSALVLLVALPLLVASGHVVRVPLGGWVGWAVVAGLTWAGAMAALYTALARGTMGVVAPIASCGMLVPFVAGLVAGERPGALQVVGAVLALVGVVGVAGPELSPSTRTPPLAVGLALLAALLFGVEIEALARASETSVAGSLLGMRLTSVVLVVAVAFARRRDAAPVGRRDLSALLGLGVLDLGATAAYALASTAGLVSVVAVLASLYPAVTVLLAGRFHGERLARVQVAGVVVVLLGAVLTSVG